MYEVPNMDHSKLVGSKLDHAELNQGLHCLIIMRDLYSSEIICSIQL